MESKISKATADYTKHAKKNFCRDCTMFRKPARCSYVLGSIDPNGSCKFFKLLSYKAK